MAKKKKRKEKRWTHIYTKNMPWDLFTPRGSF